MADEDKSKVAELALRYEALCHAMQSGVAYFAGDGISKDMTPKHLRVGVNSALVDSSALARLLMRKGVIGEVEYYEALVEGMEDEVKRYHAQLPDHLIGKVTFA